VGSEVSGQLRRERRQRALARPRPAPHAWLRVRRGSRRVHIICGRVEIRGRSEAGQQVRPLAEIRTSGCEIRVHRRREVRHVDRRRTRPRAHPRRGPGQRLRIAGLAAQETDPAQPEIGELEVPVLVDEQVVRLQITERGKSGTTAASSKNRENILTDERCRADAATPARARPPRRSSSPTPPGGTRAS
jgi:hypothetical protein